jgi:hypothetical protein
MLMPGFITLVAEQLAGKAFCRPITILQTLQLHCFQKHKLLKLNNFIVFVLYRAATARIFG